MTTESALAFRDNQIDMGILPILPADQNMAGLSTHFQKAVGASVEQTLPSPLLSQKMDGQSILANAEVASASLQGISGMNVSKDGIGYLGSSIASMGGELLNSLQGKEPDFEEVKFKPAPSFSMGMPSPAGMG